jgi:glycosyltransferase involved in cell wall biosynthesis
MTKPVRTAPLVAIVTPVYNGAAFLAETMECVQKLDYSSLVHIVLDNASTDATSEIIAQYRDRRVPVVLERNPKAIPMARNWNAAVAMVPREAAYFRLLCADDIMTPHAISRMVAVASQDPEIAVVGCLCRNDRFFGEEILKDREVFDGPEVLRSYLRREHAALNGTHSLIRRTQLDAYRPYYDETIAGFDRNANMRSCLHNKYGFVHEELALWRLHEASETATYATGTHAHVAEWLVLLDRYGPSVLGFQEYLACRRAHRRHYLRRLLLIRWWEKNNAMFERHMRGLRMRDDVATWVDFADAMADFLILVATARRHRIAISRRPPFARQTGTAATAYFIDQIERYSTQERVDVESAPR